MRRPERLFERYRRKGDLDALGSVFDRLAPGLLRIAMHFAPDPAAAEDLLQETFLTAIEEAPRYDAGRPLRPWLVGILRNHARQGWRRRGRDAARALPSEMTAAPTKDPVDDIAWSVALSEQIEQLPAPMRQILVLRLKHGMAPADIATLLDVAPATVRTRLHRGLAKLRTSMPRNGVPAALMVLPVSVGLPLVRAQVLSAAASAATATVAASTAGALTLPLLGGIVMTHKTLVIAAAVALPLLGGGVAWMTGAFDAPEVPHNTRTAETVTVPSEKPDDAPKLQVADRPTPAPTDPKKAAAPSTPAKPAHPGAPLDAPIPEDKGSVAGVVTFEDGTPLRNTPLALWGSPNVICTTDDQGRYHIHADWVNDRSLFIKKDAYQLIFAPTRMVKGKLITVDATLQRGVDMRAQVVHGDTRAPLEGVSVTLRREERDTQAHAVFAKTDGEGRFLMEYLPKVKFTVELNLKGFKPELMHLDLAEDPVPTTFEMRPSQPFTVNLANLPDDVKGTRVQWHMIRINSTLSFSGKSEVSADGEVVIDHPGAGAYVLTIFKTEVMPRVSEQFTLQEGMDRISIALPAYGSMVGTLHDRQGKPLPKTRIQLGTRASQFATTDKNGRFEIKKAPAGKHDVWVYPSSTSLAYGEVEIVAGEETHEDMVLRGGSEITARILVDGKPVGRHGGNVHVRDATTKKFVATGSAYEEGRVRVRYLPRGSYLLEISSRGSVTKRRRVELGIEQKLDLGDVELSGFEAVPVTLIAPEGVKSSEVTLLPKHEDGVPLGPTLAGSGMGRLKETSDGGLALTGIPPGTHRLQVFAKGCRPLVIELTLPYKAAKPLEIRLEAR